MDRPQFEVADVFRYYGADYRLQNGDSMSNAQHRVMTAIEVCRTAVLGGHLEQCDQCGHQRNAFNSCANRHCPKCQSLARAQWLQDRQAELLNTEYFHVVFTVPDWQKLNCQTFRLKLLMIYPLSGLARRSMPLSEDSF